MRMDHPARRPSGPEEDPFQSPIRSFRLVLWKAQRMWIRTKQVETAQASREFACFPDPWMLLGIMAEILSNLVWEILLE